ncbi:acyltransferase [Porphyromonas gingivalis]|uniref:Acyltransferase n=1 Tax=Porphyromonas gingivalis TaxID=837 RepID=A0AAE9XHB0_PORGN|nr:acyltransferase [Porphyromonas gingivalis]WCG02996.1 acyltransferase [Porphyromonas gingivalis]SJL29863.1 Polysialic acid O-acetyltransferase [Porphyromonas gingivalis]
MKKRLETFKRLYSSGKLREIMSILDSRYGLGRLERLLFTNWFNPLATLWLNLRSLPFLQAVRFPIFVYGRPRFYSLSGRIKIEGKVVPGMIKFNIVLPGAPSNMSVQSELYNDGLIIFRGKGEVGTGNKILVSIYGVLDIGEKFRISDMCNITCLTSVTLGKLCRIAHRGQILDGSFHYVANFDKRSVQNHTRPIRIGDQCWIGNSSTVSAGAVLPNFVIVASNSLVGKDYAYLKEGSLIGGAPAKLIAEGMYRVEASEANTIIGDYFRLTEEPIYHIPDGVVPEDYYRYK